MRQVLLAAPFPLPGPLLLAVLDPRLLDPVGDGVGAQAAGERAEDGAHGAVALLLGRVRRLPGVPPAVGGVGRLPRREAADDGTEERRADAGRRVREGRAERVAGPVEVVHGRGIAIVATAVAVAGHDAAGSLVAFVVIVVVRRGGRHRVEGVATRPRPGDDGGIRRRH